MPPRRGAPAAGCHRPGRASRTGRGATPLPRDRYSGRAAGRLRARHERGDPGRAGPAGMRHAHPATERRRRARLPEDASQREPLPGHGVRIAHRGSLPGLGLGSLSNPAAGLRRRLLRKPRRPPGAGTRLLSARATPADPRGTLKGMGSDSVELVRRIYLAWHAGDLEELLSLVDPEVSWSPVIRFLEGRVPPWAIRGSGGGFAAFGSPTGASGPSHSASRITALECLCSAGSSAPAGWEKGI
jgi:hypothetical protein